MQNDEDREQYAKEMKRFSALFGRFLQEEGPSVEWDRIQKLPVDAVKDYATLTNPTNEETVNRICEFCSFIKKKPQLNLIFTILPDFE